ncbi:LEAF RUST 10 DISEASE-RESISTANCE LOCUS RECEPTOR-LIKE PROTEIN KINASE-like 1.2 isoform X4 [Citrus sinensis]|uniref:LEAF RUST 10 DISEASE-RESISTANCE LOCUS RECEPTOR-LIKE PROTEIN KINASE-like 1.2 isoform X4 n=1 Tax=Citrus sinensis TaxID=2711 RepID=UPI002277F20F|nr:LEAF RUST 10 DISEASE-RESISTANCE LOCUS RECEPTOR-LIKE PROTEIN KINASE-like 1.2 isoform X4 [Citrus sinensis]
MDLQNIFTLKITLLRCIIIIITFSSHTLSLDPKFKACAPRTCGNDLIISYPFWISEEQEPFCGYPNFGITCNDKNPVLTISRYDYIIKDIFYPNTSLLVANSLVYEESCQTPLQNLTLDRTPFNFSSKTDLFIWYNCTENPPQYGTYPINCYSNATLHSFAGFHKDVLVDANYSFESCQSFAYAPVHLDNGVDLASLGSMNYTEILKMGFLLNWTAHSCSNCEASGGRCGFSNNEFVCFCEDRPHLKTCDDGNGANLKLKVAIGVGAAFGGMGIMAAIFLIYLRRKKNKHSASTLLFRNTSSEPSSKVDLEKGGNYHGVQVFSYGELEEATNYFDSARELGDGGFGTVYYGELQDGRAVAVKRLYENNYKRVEQFMNEVDILARLRHKNLVSLYGCTSRHSRELLLVYEFISNGTVADHLHGERAKPGALPWPTRLKIAIETASALTYLHASDIIHRDVKTNNILLDNNFCVKVADFGLSRLFPNHVTHVSTAPQGTPGYVDPEYHQCYQLTDKSDVFSFGVVLIELISSMPAVDITRHRHEINLSNLAINKIQNKALHELVDQTLGYESDNKVRRTINAVAELAFQCLQSEKDLRPYMVDVLDALRDIESDGYDDKKTHEEMMTQSPDSVTLSWTSTKTTPTSSS